MIYIGDLIIDEYQIAAIYPSVHTPGKVWISLRSGRTVWAIERMDKIRMALEAAGVQLPCCPKVEIELRTLASLLHCGYAYLCRDETGELWAFEGEPSKWSTCWHAESGKKKPVRDDIFDGIVEWPDKEATDIEILLEEMRTSPEQYEEE